MDSELFSSELDISSVKKCYKIILAGDGGTGKSTLLSTRQKGSFEMSAKITIGVDFDILKVQDQTRQATFQIWDLGGQDRFHFVHDLYIKGASGGIILYDLTRPQTFDHLPHWINLFLHEKSTIPLIIAGTKKDLISPSELVKYASKWIKLSAGLALESIVKKHLFISSKNFEGINEIFLELLKAVNNNHEKPLEMFNSYSVEPCL